MTRISMPKLADSNLVTDYLDKDGGGAGGATEEFVLDEDAKLQANITAEATARTDADTTLQKNIDDANTSITTETTARTDADSTLQTNITAEETARTTADTDLQTQIDGLSGGGAEKEIIYIWNVSANGVDVDCSVIDKKFNTLNVINVVHNEEILISNIENSNIRYFFSETNTISNRYLSNSVTFEYLTNTDLMTVFRFYAHESGDGLEFITFSVFDDKALRLPNDTGGSFFISMFHHREKVFFIRFNKDLTLVTEYFNTDEFLLPFSKSSFAYTHNIDLFIQVWQPTDRHTGGIMVNTSYQYINTTICKSPLSTTNWLFDYPIHTSCMVMSSAPMPNIGFNYVSYASIYGVDVFCISGINKLDVDRTDSAKIITPIAQMTSVFVYNNNNNIFLSTNSIKTLVDTNKVCNNYTLTSSGVRYDISYQDRMLGILSKEYTASTWTGEEDESQRSLGFYISSNVPHALTNVSFFDKDDTPISTGYNPTTRSVAKPITVKARKGSGNWTAVEEDVNTAV